MVIDKRTSRPPDTSVRTWKERACGYLSHTARASPTICWLELIPYFKHVCVSTAPISIKRRSLRGSYLLASRPRPESESGSAGKFTRLGVDLDLLALFDKGRHTNLDSGF